MSLSLPRPAGAIVFPYTTLFRSLGAHDAAAVDEEVRRAVGSDLLGEVLVALDLGLVGVAVERGADAGHGAEELTCVLQAVRAVERGLVLEQEIVQRPELGRPALR